MGLILDTTEFVSAERMKLSLSEAFAFYPSEEEFSISILTVAELQHGVRRAANTKQYLQRRQLLYDALAICKVQYISMDIALRAGTIDAELAMQGQKTDLIDLLIAATALELGYGVVTGNLDHFERVSTLPIVVSPLRS